jgi:hypothetical protein
VKRFKMPDKLFVVLVAIVILLALVFGISQWFYLRKAHSTFENYYAFRGCVQLLDKTDDYGICKTNSGQTIKIVKYQNKWYLDGDLPWACLGGICFGL